MHEIIDANQCVFCGKYFVEDDSIPSFIHNDTEYCDVGQCVCHACVNEHLDFNEKFGDYEAKPGCLLPELARPVAHFGITEVESVPRRIIGFIDNS